MASLPRLVFAHANGFPGASYRSFLAPLGTRFDLHPLERLGHDPAHPVSDNWPALRDELVRHLNALETPVIGVGHSMGGVLMLMAADVMPDAFRCVVMLDSPLMVGVDALGLRTAKRLKLADRVTPAGRSLGRRSTWPDREAMGHYLRRRALFKRFTDDALRDYIEGGTACRDDGSIELLFDPAVEVEIFRHLPDHLHGLARRLRVPLAMIAGEHSDLLKPSRRRRLRRHGVRVEQTPGGHMFPMEFPDQARDTLLTTIDSLLENEPS
ncbi:Pimeloyl-ACP methyl ester carboxylesterase [Modicisalibacter ilicicola DSM 19980]|uniref:Pimeloyl-ACP methyl ester carboxylesterase n=1 Tax=Modicisalibacter ilicicola DSM 19980 TaxID=1121942 RepID=A0A1M5BJF1_9GAMM|nr:alpha/beta hydrolase [Halomonas ilicicola]SHF42566.1 Pimeloyl-ACP methyl ester carboxylesterase [Halomonas ilicicola DSM 19980]